MPKIAFIILRANDIEKTREFYQTYFGFEFENHLDHCSPHYAAQTDGVLLEIYKALQPNTPQDMIGFTGINLDDIVAKIPTAHIVKAPADSKYGKFMIITDPDARKLYLEAQK